MPKYHLDSPLALKNPIWNVPFSLRSVVELPLTTMVPFVAEAKVRRERKRAVKVGRRVGDGGDISVRFLNNVWYARKHFPGK